MEKISFQDIYGIKFKFTAQKSMLGPFSESGLSTILDSINYEKFEYKICLNKKQNSLKHGFWDPAE